MSGVIIAVPDVTQFKINSDMDYIVLGCKIYPYNILGDGIFDQLSDKEVTDCIWMTLKESAIAKNVHIQCGMAIDMIIKSSLVRRTLDNVTAVMIAFQNFESYFQNDKNITDKNIKVNVQNKEMESAKVENNYHSNKENNSNKIKAKLNEELDKNENYTINNNNSQNTKLSSQISSDQFGSNDKKFYSKKLNIDLAEEKSSPKKQGSFHSSDIKYSIPKEYPVTTKNKKSNSFKGDLVKK